MADPDISEIDQSVAPPIGGDINFNLNNERLDCEHLGKKSPEAGDYQNINKIWRNRSHDRQLDRHAKTLIRNRAAQIFRKCFWWEKRIHSSI